MVALALAVPVLAAFAQPRIARQFTEDVAPFLRSKTIALQQCRSILGRCPHFCFLYYRLQFFLQICWQLLMIPGRRAQRCPHRRVRPVYWGRRPVLGITEMGTPKA